MTDNEIIKALECHASHKDECDNCPNAEISLTVCSEITAENALALINRQKAEIETLRTQLDFWAKHIGVLDKIISQQESEIKNSKLKVLNKSFHIK